MDQNDERRQEERLDYHSPVWFSEDFTETMSLGLMVDVASGGIAFDCPQDSICPHKGQYLTVRFSIPRFEGDDPTATVSITRTGRVCRVEDLETETHRVALQFDTPLALRPSELAALNSISGGHPES